jgi:GntR family transcriptional regulator
MADPLYRRIAQDLMRKIESGELEPGAQLPNEVEFREQYEASRNTVRDAIKWLVIRGLVQTLPGRGTFVVGQIEPFVTTLSEDPDTGMTGGEGVAAFAEINKRQQQKYQHELQLWEQAHAAWKHRQDARENPDIKAARSDQDDDPEPARPDEPPLARASTPTVEVKFAADFVAERLRINVGDEVLVRHQEFYVGRTPWSLQTTFYPMDLVDRGATALMRAKDIEEGTVKYLQDALGLHQCGYRVRISVRAPNDHEARFFGLPEDGRVSVISVIRTGYEEKSNEGPHPFRTTFTVLPADRNQFVINAHKVPEELATPARDQYGGPV